MSQSKNCDECYVSYCTIQVKIQGQNSEMLLAACQQFLGKSDSEILHIALETLEGHQRAIMGTMTVEVCPSIPCHSHASIIGRGGSTGGGDRTPTLGVKHVFTVYMLS